MITTYQIRNVLRVYGDQLKKRNRIADESIMPSYQPVDFVNISIDARRKQMLSQISSNFISKLNPTDQQGDSGMEVSENALAEAEQRPAKA